MELVIFLIHRVNLFMIISIFLYIDYFSVNLQVMDFNRYYIMKIWK